MRNPHGDFIWYELMTTDADAAAEFYGGLLGWQVSPGGSEDVDYRILNVADKNGPTQAGGLLALTAAMCSEGAQPGWFGYIGVDDVDATVEATKTAGGQILMPATDLPGVGRMALLRDPQGAAFYVMRGAMDKPSQAFAKYEPRVGHCAWNELATSNPAAALAFYSAQFGWQKDGEMPMPDLGAYQFIRHEVMIGAIMPQLPDMPAPTWTFYFRVADIDVAAQRIAETGGQLLHEPEEIPGGDFILHAFDPQGAYFALIGARA